MCYFNLISIRIVKVKRCAHLVIPLLELYIHLLQSLPYECEILLVDPEGEVPVSMLRLFTQWFMKPVAEQGYTGNAVALGNRIAQPGPDILIDSLHVENASVPLGALFCVSDRESNVVHAFNSEHSLASNEIRRGASR